MTLKQAREIGKECGLESDMEYLANIELHCTMLFRYEDMERELNELRDDCIAQGVDYDKLLTEFNNRFVEKIEQATKCCGNCFYAGDGVCDNHEGEWAGEISTDFVCEKYKEKMNEKL